MEEKKNSSPIDNPETISPAIESPSVNVPAADSSPSPPPDVPDEMESTARTSPEPEEKRPGLAQRLAEAFREGVASTKPDYVSRPDVRIPPPARESRQQSSDAGILDRVSQEGRSASAIIGDKAASAVDAVFQLVKKAPAMTQKYAEAFREGAASVKPREGRERRQERPPSAKKNWLPSGGEAILGRVFQAGGSAVEIIRGTVAALKPGDARRAGHKICLYKKKIDNLYTEIGREAVNTWDSGAIESEKISALLDELRKNEEEIQNLQEEIAKAAEARKAEEAKRQEAAKETALTPIMDKGDITIAVGASDDKPDVNVYHLGDLREQQERPESVDVTVAEPSASPAPEAESPISPSAPAYTGQAEALPPTPPALDIVVEAEPAPLKEVSGDGSDQAMPEEPEMTQEETEAQSPPSPPAPEYTVEAKAVPPTPPAPELVIEAEPVPRKEGLSNGSDRAPSRKLEVSQEKPKKLPPGKGRRGAEAPSGRKRGRR